MEELPQFKTNTFIEPHFEPPGLAAMGGESRSRRESLQAFSMAFVRAALTSVPCKGLRSVVT